MQSLNNIESQEANLKNLAQDIISLAKQKGASQSELFISTGKGLSVSVRKQEIDTIEFDKGKSLGITVYFDQHKGSSSTSDLSKEAIETAVDKACDIAKLMAKDEYCGLADKELMAFDENLNSNIDKNLDLYHPWDITPEDAKALVLECEQHGLNYSDKITNSEGADLSTHLGMSVYANSYDFIGVNKTSKHTMSCLLLASEKSSPDKMQRDYWYSTSRIHNNLESPKDIGIKAATRAINRLNPRKLKTQKSNILFSPEMARGIINSFISAISGGNLYRESSFLLNKLNKKVFSDIVTIIDDPFIKQGFGSGLFDNDGVTTNKRTLVSNGILKGYVLSNYSARRLNMQTTGNSGGVHNILVTNNDNSSYKTQLDIIKDIKSGFLVTELMGQGVNIVTGDYSRGASGYWIENGEIAYPVEGVTIAGNLKKMLFDISLIGNDIDKRSNIYTGSILIDNMMIAGE